MSIDDKADRTFVCRNLDHAAPEVINIFDLHSRCECHHDRIGQDSFRLFEIITDLANMAGNLRALKTTELAATVARDALDEGKLL